MGGGDSVTAMQESGYSAGDNMLTKAVYTPPSTTETTVFAYNTADKLTKHVLNNASDRHHLLRSHRRDRVGEYV